MTNIGHLGKRELFALGMVVSAANNFLTHGQQLALLGGSAGWMIPLLSMGIALGVWAVIAPALDQAREFLRSGREGASKVLAACGLLVVVVLMLEAASTMRLFTETVITTVMPRSPISYIAIPLLLVTVYYAYTGIEALSRVAWLLTPLLMGGFLLLLVLNINWMSPEYLFPFWGRGVPELLISGGMMTGLFENVLVLALLGTLLRDPKAAGRIGYGSIVVVGLSYALVTMVLILVFSPDGAMRAPFPLYQLGRLIYVGRFIQRLEASFVFIWVAMALIKLAFHLWLSAYLLANICRMPLYRPLVFPLAVIAYALSFLPGSFVETLELSTQYLMRWNWIVYILLPLLAALWVRMRARKEGGTEDEQNASTA